MKRFIEWLCWSVAIGLALYSVARCAEPTLKTRKSSAANQAAEPIRDSPNETESEPARPRTADKGSATEQPSAAQVAPDAAVSPPDAAPDLRPVVFVYSLFPPGQCPPCEHQQADEKELYEFRFVHEPAPAWVVSSPTLVFTASDGKPRQLIGWEGPQWFRAAWQRNNPELVAARRRVDTPPHADMMQAVAAASKDIADKIRQFVGDEGEFFLKPLRPIQSEVSPGAVLSYSAIKGKIKIEAGNVPTIYLTDPLPRVDYKLAGIVHVGLTLYRIEVIEKKGQPMLQIGTSLGRFRFKLEESK